VPRKFRGGWWAHAPVVRVERIRCSFCAMTGLSTPSPVVQSPISAGSGAFPLVVAAPRPVPVDKIAFDNVPDLSHLPAGAIRKNALKQHRQWEDQLSDTPMATLHYQLSGKFTNGLHRQTLAYVTAKYCTKNIVSFESLMTSVEDAGGLTSTSGLVTTRREDLKPVVNLLALPNNVLWEVYCSIPDHRRQAEKPPRPPRSPRPSDLKVRRTIGKKKKRFVPKAIHLASATPIEETFVWVCCDACAKWRRLFNTTENVIPETWQCSDHPSDVRCIDPEEEMEDGEKWDGELRGALMAQDAAHSMSVSSSVQQSGLATPMRASSPTESSEDVRVSELIACARQSPSPPEEREEENLFDVDD
jgi:hypothetical protein